MELWGFNWKCAMEGGRLIHPDYPYIWYDEDCIKSVHKYNMATISLQYKPNVITYWDGTVYHPQIAGGVLRSEETFSYGRFEAELFLPKGFGLWPSFWLCGEGPWPESGEIDIEEGYSDSNYFRLFTPYFPWLNPSWKTTNNVHYSLNGEHKQAGARSVSIFKQFYNPSDSFIKYECVWTPEDITFYVGGKKVRKDSKCSKEFKSNKMHVIFNLWCENYMETEVKMETPMLIKNFKYTPL